MSDQNPKPKEKSTTHYLSLLPAMVSAVGIALTFAMSYMSYRNTIEIQKFNNSQRLFETNLQTMLNLHGKVMEVIVDCATSKDRSIELKGQVVVSLIDSVLQDQSSAVQKFKADLLRTMNDSRCEQLATPEVTQSLETAESVVRKTRVEAAKETSGFNAADWRNFDIDIFWCEKSPNAELLATTLQQKILASDDTRRSAGAGFTRVRMLSEDKNKLLYKGSKKGFQIFANKDSAEQSIAKNLGDIAKTAIEKDFEQRLSLQETKYYVSAFVCPAT